MLIEMRMDMCAIDTCYPTWCREHTRPTASSVVEAASIPASLYVACGLSPQPLATACRFRCPACMRRVTPTHAALGSTNLCARVHMCICAWHGCVCQVCAWCAACARCVTSKWSDLYRPYLGIAHGIARVWACRYPKWPPRRGGHFGYRRAHARAIDMPSAMPR